MTDSPPSIGTAELQRVLSSADPAALLVPPRLLRRVIKQDCGIPGMGLQVPHRKSYVVGRETLLTIAERDELGLAAATELPPTIVLLGCPETWLAAHTRSQALLRYWRLLFHARIDQALNQQFADGKLTDAALREKVQRLGQVEFEEACQVLRQENFLLPPGDLRICFREFVALYLELKYFARHLLGRYFPAIEDPDRVEPIFAEVIDADSLFTATRPEGAPDPILYRAHLEAEEEREAAALTQGKPAPAHCLRLLARADKVAARGNVVRAALLRTRAAVIAPPDVLETARKGALADLDRLVNRLQSALELHDREAEEWRATLPALLGPAARGLWPPSARLLYDLQKVCVDYERDLYAVDLVEWVVSLGAKPIKRPVPLQSDVLLVKHLRNAAKRLGRANISEEDRRRLGILLRSAIHHCEERLREKLRPRLTDALEDVGFRPANYPEEVARKKIVEDVLDRVTERGFLTMGDLRDAISRNQLKLPDVGRPDTVLLGDQLIRLNRKLAVELDGVYHRGEIYLRWLQRLSSLFFGTQIGRWITLFLILPFGGAFAALVFAEEIFHLTQKVIAPEAAKATTEEHEGLALPPPEVTVPVVGLLGVFLLLLIHSPPFRTATWRGTKRAWRGLRAVLIDAPAAFFNLPAVRRFLSSRPVVLFRRYLLRPLASAALAAVVCRFFRAGGVLTGGISGTTFLIALGMFNSRFGRRMEEETTDWMARNWYWLRVDVLPGLLRLIMDFFKLILDRLDRIIYTVDEWLRFRSGDSRWTLVYKPVLGLVWFFLTYAIRVIINLFVEPTVNPIKHFPAVTVGAKLIAPFALEWTAAWTILLAPTLGHVLGKAMAWTLFVLIPGIFGFAVWEFKENWKLYRSNRSPVLRPVMIGHHGETMLRFMKPGFHSGTLPKLYAKLRKAERRDHGKALHRHQETLHHVKESIHHFVERELLLLLEGSKNWGGLRIRVGAMQVACGRVRVELCCPDLGDDGVWLAFEERSGWLVGEVTQPGWLSRLSVAQRDAFLAGLAGLYKLAGVMMVREQIEVCLPPGVSAYRVSAEGLVLWRGGDFSSSVVCDLRESEGAPVPGSSLTPLASADDCASLSAERVLFTRMPVAWDDWVAAWTRDQVGEPVALSSLGKVRLLPELPSEVSANGTRRNADWADWRG
ncbi:MAG: hypothetical protein HYS12_25660 [Planctomycetes bacterium]|nr:hypothetical protein [Planctomycetota bacterium]